MFLTLVWRRRETQRQMVARAHTVAFQGIDVVDVDVQVQITMWSACRTRRWRSRASGCAARWRRSWSRPAAEAHRGQGRAQGGLPLRPADRGRPARRHGRAAGGRSRLGCALDGSIARVGGVLPAAVSAVGYGRGLICPRRRAARRPGRALEILAPPTLLSLINHFKGNLAPADVLKEGSHFDAGGAPPRPAAALPIEVSMIHSVAGPRRCSPPWA